MSPLLVQDLDVKYQSLRRQKYENLKERIDILRLRKRMHDLHLFWIWMMKTMKKTRSTRMTTTFRLMMKFGLEDWKVISAS